MSDRIPTPPPLPNGVELELGAGRFTDSPPPDRLGGIPNSSVFDVDIEPAQGSSSNDGLPDPGDPSGDFLRHSDDDRTRFWYNLLGLMVLPNRIHPSFLWTCRNSPIPPGYQ